MNEVIQSRIDFSDFSTVGFKILLDNFRAFKGDASNPFAVAPKAVQALVDNYDYSSANSGNITAFISDYCEIGMITKTFTANIAFIAVNWLHLKWRRERSTRIMRCI